MATSGNTLFRNIGSSVGTAIVGTIFATELASHLRADFPHASSAQLNTSHFSSATLAKLPPAIHETYLAAYASSLDTAFKVAGFVSIAAFIASWFIKQLPMRETMTTEDLGGAFGAPRSGDSLSEILRALSVLVGRQQMRQWLERVASDAGMDLPIADGWVLVQLRRDPSVDLTSLASSQKIPLNALEGAVADLVERGLLARPEPEALAAGTDSTDPVGEGAGLTDSTEAVAALPAAYSLSPSGALVADQLIDAVRTRLSGLLQGWSPEQYPELVRLLDQFASDIVPGTHAMAGVPAGSSAPLVGP